jgi:predicted transcriptional regulator
MTQADERILELLKNNGAHPSGAIREMLAEISCELEYSRPHISRRCKKLADHRLLRKNYKNYTLSNQGKQFLDMELNASELTPTEYC